MIRIIKWFKKLLGAEPSNPSEKKHSTWTLVTDEIEQVGFSMKEIEYYLEGVKNSDVEFLILNPLHPISIKSTGRTCNFVQTCLDNSGWFHFEVSIMNTEPSTGSVIYGKDEMRKEDAMGLIKRLLDYNVIPDIQNWEVVLEIRPNKDDMPFKSREYK